MPPTLTKIPPHVTFFPHCGSPGDRIDVSIDSACSENEYAIHFTSGTPGVDLSATSNPQTVSDTCQATLVTVPAGAVTGPITVTEKSDNYELSETSEESFQIPCPPDAGQPDTGTGVPPGTPPPPPLEYGGSFTVAGGGTDSQFFATFLKAGSPSALAGERKTALSLVAPDGVAKGTCVKRSTGSGPPPPPLDGADVGPIELRAGGSVVATAAPQTNGTSTQYNVLIPGTPAEVLAVLTDPAHAKTFKPLPLPAPPSVTSPDVSGTVTVPSGSGLTLTYAPSTATNMALSLTHFNPLDLFDCVLDPAAGTFTVPPTALPDPGSWSAQLVAGNVVSDELEGREVLGISNSSLSFSVDVQ